MAVRSHALDRGRFRYFRAAARRGVDGMRARPPRERRHRRVDRRAPQLGGRVDTDRRVLGISRAGVVGGSQGLFFVWTALFLLAAGVAHGVAVEDRRRLTLLPIWFLLGATGMCAAILVFHWLRGGQHGEAELVIGGSRLFAALVVLVVVVQAFRTALMPLLKS